MDVQVSVVGQSTMSLSDRLSVVQDKGLSGWVGAFLEHLFLPYKDPPGRILPSVSHFQDVRKKSFSFIFHL